MAYQADDRFSVSIDTQTKFFWVGVLYFGEGFPFGLLLDAYPVYFRLHGVSLTQIGLLSLIGLAWTLKWMWAPAVDLWGERRTWIVGCQVLLSLGILCSVFLDPTHIGILTWLLLFLLAFGSATQDVAIDAYSIQLLKRKELGPGNGIRVMTYRIALIVSGGLFLAAGGFFGWLPAFLFAGALLGGSALFIFWRLPQPMPYSRIQGHSARERVLTSFSELIRRRGFMIVAFFILTFKLGDMALGPMIRPFWVDRGFTPVQIGMIPGTIGVIMTILGALGGGVFTAKWGIYKAMWVLGLAQAASNLMYVLVAARESSEGLMYSASIVESFCGGLGTAPFLAFLMSICNKSFAATQYALLSALFGLTRVVAGSFSGIAADQFGYTTYFAITFVLAFPALALLPFIKQWTLDLNKKGASA